ncbi:glutathione S-transferase family protein [Polyangium aurulentum]|uniref:glutathione S-transferase family protein n=1 Tax=Polyangium aurulentum TaxID=2567896 RepID=UPI0010AE1A9E|nr:glutathione S-transferase family protein [Polyangium aurulentum]UQA60075.1 glutathione S-transferase N-terminal domain-containing protein [Polyangium aurulentum]
MKLTYFDARGRVEPTRLMLEMTRTPYEYVATPLEAWMSDEARAPVRARTPFGQLPLLEDGGLSLCQSCTIHRYVARKLGLLGNTLEESARVDEVFETGQELYVDAAKFVWDPQFHERRAEHREATRVKLASLAGYFTKMRADPEHWVLPGRYTLADAMMAYALEQLLPLHPGLVEEHPELHHAMTRFFAADGVREYVRSKRRCPTTTVQFAQFGGKPEETHQWTD